MSFVAPSITVNFRQDRCRVCRFGVFARAGGRRFRNESQSDFSASPKRRRRKDDLELREAAEESMAQIREEASDPSYIEAERLQRLEVEERARIKEAAENAISSEGECLKCGGTGVEWSCSNCGALGFILGKSEDGSPLWRTCENCKGEGARNCPACTVPDPEDDIIRRPDW